MRDLLVLCQSLPPNASLEYAAPLALRGNGSITGIHVCEPIPMIPDMVVPTAGAMLYALLAETLQRARDAAPAFMQWARARGLEHAEWQIAQGPLPATLARAAAWHDLVVVHRSDDELAGTAGQIGRILVEVGRPLLVLPPDVPAEPVLATVAIAWNGSVEAIRAVRDALPWLQQARRVLVFEGTTRRRFDAMVEPPKFDLESWLHRRGVGIEHARVDSIEGDDGSVGRMVLARVVEAGADLLVMGGYGRPRASELLLGGVTRHVLSHASVPVLLRH